MYEVFRNPARRVIVSLLALVLVLAVMAPVYGKDKKKKAPAPAAQPNILERLDVSKIVWPNPPAIARIKYLKYFSAERIQSSLVQKKKVPWMDRLAGVATGETPKSKPRFQLVTPYGVAADSKGRLYVADSKVLAVFVFDTETGEVELIKNGTHARFGWITGLTIDDDDRLFVADSKMRRVVVFNSQRQALGTISEGMVDPGGMAIDTENRLLYVADAEQDQVLVYDADSPFKLLRRIGTGGKAHTLTTSGDFAMPSNVAVDKSGNVYISDTLNNRVQVFDAEGTFIRSFGKAGDGPGYFGRPKGIAIDGDGHVWVADGVQNRVQVFTPEGRLLIYMGESGLMPGQFRALAGLTIDRKNRVFTSEQFPGRVQMFQYVSDAEAQAQREGRGASGSAKDAAAKSPQ